MTKTAKRIADLVETLSPDAQAALLDIAEALARPHSFYDTMTPEQRAELELSLAQADAGDVISHDEVNAGIAALFAGRTRRSSLRPSHAARSSTNSTTSSISAPPAPSHGSTLASRSFSKPPLPAIQRPGGNPLCPASTNCGFHEHPTSSFIVSTEQH